MSLFQLQERGVAMLPGRARSVAARIVEAKTVLQEAS